MSLFPQCTFELELGESVLRAGSTHEVSLVLATNRDLGRAERVRVEVRSTAQAGVGGGKNRTVYTEHLWHDVFDFPLPPEGLRAGTHRFPFRLSVPADLGPAFTGDDCSRTHELEARLEVDWAVDPSAKFTLPIVSPPATGELRPLVHRSHREFARDFLVDLSIESNVLVWGQVLRGEVALRAAPEKKCKRLVLRLSSRETVRMKGFDDVRRTPRQEVVIPMVDLAEERRVRFAIPTSAIVYTHRDGFLDNEVELSYELDLAWSSPEAAIAITVLPPESVVHGQGTLVALPARRTVDQGDVIRVQLADAPREGAAGALVTLDFPSLALGTRLRELGLLDGFAHSPLLPAKLAQRFRLRSETGTLDASHRAALYQALLAELSSCNQLELTDESLRYHLTLEDDTQFDEVERQALARVRRLRDALAAIPFAARLAPQEDAWRVVAAAAGALLVPHRPAIHGLSVVLRTSLGEPRVFPYTLAADDDHLEVRVRLEELGGSFAAREELGKSPLLERLREHATLAWATPWQIAARAPHAGFDARKGVLAAETIAAWVMHARGEARLTSPYR